MQTVKNKGRILCSKTVVGSEGFYTYNTLNKATLRSGTEELAKFMTTELTEGCFDDPTVLCGLIGEVGCTWPLHGIEKWSWVMSWT